MRCQQWVHGAEVVSSISPLRLSWGVGQNTASGLYGPPDGGEPLSKQGFESMPHRDAPALNRKIDAALDYISDSGDELRPYLIWQLEEMMGGPDHITLDDCKTSVLMSLVALLAPVFSARLGSGDVVSPPDEGSGNRVLTLIHGDGVDTGT